MPETGAEMESLELTCRTLRKEGEGVLSWSWDDSFEAMLTTYGAGDSQRVQELLGRTFVREWSKDSIGQAPPGIRKFAESLGGLRSGQKLVASAPGCTWVVLAALWPWSGGKMTSIRLWLFSEGLPAEQVPAGKLRSWFAD